MAQLRRRAFERCSIPRAKREKDEPYSDKWAVLQGAQSLLVVYRVNDHKKAEGHKVGTVQVCRSWEELEARLGAESF